MQDDINNHDYVIISRATLLWSIISVQFGSFLNRSQST